MRRRTAVFGLAFAVLAGGSASAGWFGERAVVPDVVLVDTLGGEWTFAELVRDRPVLLSFFFTGCSSLCPLQTATMQGVRQELQRRGVAPKAMPLMLSVSLDPFGDTPEAIERYAAGFGIKLGPEVGWLMLNGRPADLDRVKSAFEEPRGIEGDHTGVLWFKGLSADRWSPLLALGEPRKIADLIAEGAMR